MDEQNPSAVKELYCIEYPGNVRNPARMIETLGGINSISNAFSNTQRKLELKFRPEDKFCKSVNSERSKNTSFLLRVTVKRVKSDDENEKDKRIVKGTAVVGKVCRVFTFKGLMDYQYLPMEKKSDGKLESIYDAIVPNNIVPLSWLNEDVPLCMIPAFFCRSDSMQPYLPSNKPVDESKAVIGRTRDRRSNYVKFVSHGEKKVPTKPHNITLRYISLKMVSENEILKIKELFDERPIWTKSALSCVTRFSNVQLKYLLSLRAYHFTSGPWRIAWVRFGYDPRKDPTARKYQIVDYRIRANILTVLRSLNPKRYAPSGRSKYPKSIDEDDEDKFDDDYYIFKPGSLPPQKQMFYQACDIQIPEVEDRLRESSLDLKYDTKYGWLSEPMLEFIRDQMDKHIVTVLQSTAGSSTSPATELLLMRRSNIDDVCSSSTSSEDSVSDMSDGDFDLSSGDDNENS